jgi:hypothetical protein
MLKPIRPHHRISAVLLFFLLRCGFSMETAHAQVVSQNRFTAPDAWEVGNAMAAAGTTLVIGDQYWNANVSRTTLGNAYVFTLTKGQWSQTAELTAGDGQAYDLFGSSVAISGTTLVVGAAKHGKTGAVYVFTLSKGKWAQTQEILPADGQAGDRFGCAVSLSGNTLAVGACQKGSWAAGSVYTYTLNAGVWKPQAEWAHPNPTTGCSSLFGASLSLAGTTLLIGAPGTNFSYGAAYLYTFSGGKWALTAPLTASDATSPALFGYAVVTTANAAIVGAPGASRAYTYTLNSGKWTPQSELMPMQDPSLTGFGHALALSGSTLVVSALNSDEEGTTIFAQSKNGWTPQAELAPSDNDVASRQSNDQFGSAVAFAGSTIVVSRPMAWPAAISPTAPLGEIYAYVSSGAEVTAPNRLNGDSYGYATAVSGSTFVAGVPGYAESTGAVYTYTRTSNSAMKLLGKITAGDGQPGDGFGTALAFSGTTLVVGAPYANNAMGAIYVYTLTSGVWTQTAELNASDGQPGDLFGNAVALSGNALVAGAPGRNGGMGGAYVYTLNGTVWGQLPVITAGDGQSGDGFGSAVGLDSGNLVIGSPNATTLVNAATGAAYVYALSGGAWSPVTKLAAVDGQSYDQFGFAVAIVGGLIAIGSPSGNGGAGAVYTFAQSAGAWTPQAELTAWDVAGSPGDQFGAALALSGSTLVVGDYGKDTYTGQVYLFALGNSGWSLTTTLTAPDGQPLDEFGTTVAISGSSIAIGAPNAADGNGTLYAY